MKRKTNEILLLFALECFQLFSVSTVHFLWGREKTILRVSPHGPYHSLRSALRDAKGGDRIEVFGGKYLGTFPIEKSLELVGKQNPVLDGKGQGTIVILLSPDILLQGFVIQNSGDQPDSNDAGILLKSPRAKIRNNRLRNVLFGIFAEKASGSLIEANQIEGKSSLSLGRKGDAIRLWYSPGVTVRKNRIAQARDLLVWFSPDTRIEGNTIVGGRYGIHLMFDEKVLIRRNRLRNNSVGIYSMYSKGIRIFENNIRGQHGSSGYGTGFKESDDVLVEKNLFVDNRVGIYLETTPFNPKGRSKIRENIMAYNSIGVALLPSSHRNVFYSNTFWENGEQVSIVGEGKALRNQWKENYWSDYRGFDLDRDGKGDIPYVAERFFEKMMDQKQQLQALRLSLLIPMVESVVSSFPLFKPEPKLKDLTPSLRVLPLSFFFQEKATTSWRTLSGALAGGGLSFLLFAFLHWGRKKEIRVGRTTVEWKENKKQLTFLSLREVSKQYGKRSVLKEVSFDITRGEVVALWGPNGAGKSTLLKAVLGIIAFGGDIFVTGTSVKQMGKETRAQIGYLPQDIRFPNWKVKEILLFYSRLRKYPFGNFLPQLEEFDLMTYLSSPVTDLSGGVRQRLALVLSLIGNPPILLLDEPTASLDVGARERFITLLRRHIAREKTVLFASHRKEEVFSIADRVAVLQQGRLLALKPLSEWAKDPENSIFILIQLPQDEAIVGERLLRKSGWTLSWREEWLAVRVSLADRFAPLPILLEAGLSVQDCRFQEESNFS